MYRVGIGYDTHILVKNRKLVLGGIEIDYEKGLLGHSDADVLLHAISDALLGAIGMGDIGKLFPDIDLKYKNISSVKILKMTYAFLKEKQFKVVNVDNVIICEKPKISPHSQKMVDLISEVLDCKAINIKATTTEKMNAEGEGKCISAKSVVLLQKELVLE